MEREGVVAWICVGRRGVHSAFRHASEGWHRSRQGEVLEKVIPIRIAFLDQPDLPGPLPCLQRLFTRNRLCDRGMPFGRPIRFRCDAASSGRQGRWSRQYKARHAACW